MGVRPVKARQEFAGRLRAARIMAGHVTQQAAATALGMPEAETYRRWERGETEPSVADLTKICEKFKVSADFLVLGKGLLVVPEQAAKRR